MTKIHEMLEVYGVKSWAKVNFLIKPMGRGSFLTKIHGMLAVSWNAGGIWYEIMGKGEFFDQTHGRRDFFYKNP